MPNGRIRALQYFVRRASAPSRPWPSSTRPWARHQSSLTGTASRIASAVLVSRKPCGRIQNYRFGSRSYRPLATLSTPSPRHPHRNDDEDDPAPAASTSTQTIKSPTTRGSSPRTGYTFGRLLAFAQPEHSLIAASAATLIVTSSTTLVLPVASGHVLDLILSGNAAYSPPFVAAGLFGLTTIAGAGVYARTLWLHRAGNTLVARLKTQLFDAIVQQDMAFLEQSTTHHHSHHDSTHHETTTTTPTTGDLLTRLGQDTALLQSAVTGQAVAALRGSLMALGSALLLWQTSPSLALVSMGTLPPLFVGARLAGRRLQEEQKQVQTLHSRATTLAEQTLQGIATVVQFGTQGTESSRYANAVHVAHEQAIATGRQQALLESAVHVAANGAVLAVLGYGGSLVVAGTLSVGELTAFLMYSLLLAGNLSGLAATYAEVSKASAAADRVWEILDREPAIPVSLSRQPAALVAPTANEVTPSKALSIEFRNVQFAYPTRPDQTVLGPQFNLIVQPGEVLSVVGESGCGKSTLAKLLTRLYDIEGLTKMRTDSRTSSRSSSSTTADSTKDDGAILINDKDIRDWDPQELRQDIIGIVSQEPWLFDGTISENIRYGRPAATEEQVRQVASLANVLSFANSFPQGLDTPVGSRGGTQLSGGQRQRVAIARLLLKDPPIVILDEATSALDASSEDLVQRALGTVMAGRTVISIAHRLSTIQTADRIAVLQDGKVVELGTFTELSQKDKGEFRSLMGRQIV